MDQIIQQARQGAQVPAEPLQQPPANGSSPAASHNGPPPPSRSMEEPLIQVVEVQPVIRAIERLSQHIAGNAERIAQGALEQREYLGEAKRAYNAMTSEWYKIAEQLPQVRAAIEELEREIKQRQEEIARGPELVRRALLVTAAIVGVVAALLTVTILVLLWLLLHHQTAAGLS